MLMDTPGEQVDTSTQMGISLYRASLPPPPQVQEKRAPRHRHILMDTPGQIDTSTQMGIRLRPPPPL